MGINVFPAPAAGGGGDSWELITSTTPPGAVTEVTFSNLSGYKSYRVVCSINTSTVSLGQQSLRINNDSGNNYSWAYADQSDGGWRERDGQTSIYISPYYNGSSIFTIDVSIECANLNAPKPISGFGVSWASYAYLYRGIYSGTSPVTSIKLLSNLNSNTTVYLYGIPE